MTSRIIIIFSRGNSRITVWMHSCTPQHIRLQTPVTANEIVAIRPDVPAAKRLRRTIIIHCSIAGHCKTIEFNAGDVTPSSVIGCANFPPMVFPPELREFHLNFLQIPKVLVSTRQWSFPSPQFQPTLSSSWIIRRKRMFRQTEYFSKSSTPSIQYT